jgi:hypothetical protein
VWGVEGKTHLGSMSFLAGTETVPELAGEDARATGVKNEICPLENDKSRLERWKSIQCLTNMRRLIVIVAIAALRIGQGLAAEGGVEPVMEKFRPVAPCAAAIAWAQTKKIPLNQIDATVDGEALNPGDSITGLVTLHEKGTRQMQWIVYSEVVTAGPKDDMGKKAQPVVFYTTLGNKLEFKSAPVMVNVRTVGPFVESGEKRKPKVEEESARFPLDKGFLGLGLERAVAAVLKFKENKEHGNFAFGPRSFGESEIAKGRKLAEITHITSDDERALCGSCPALLSYFDLVQHTPGLQDICFKVVDMPSVWSMIRHVGVTANLTFQTEQFRAADSFAWKPAGNAPVFYFPMLLELNRQPALKVTFVVTSPKPPFLGCGGIVGMLAEKPGEKETYLTLRVISARRAEPNSAR